MRTRSGKVFEAVHLEAYVGRVAVCAEAIAIGMGAAAGDTQIECIVAVNRSGDVVTPVACVGNSFQITPPTRMSSFPALPATRK
jgi:cytidine deaminase